jgi:glutamate/tyrosine decarboxylase-like PLP-dependent enzyme
MSRRGRGFVVYAALRELGAAGVAEMVERDCDMASRIARGLAADPGVRLRNEVVLNQVLFDVDGDPDLTRDVIARVQADGTAWLGGTTFHGTPAIRVSVSNWDTREDDADRTVGAIRAAIDAAREARRTGASGAG